jgi:hypothetical protein
MISYIYLSTTVIISLLSLSFAQRLFRNTPRTESEAAEELLVAASLI